MKQSGRASLITLLGFASVIVVILLFTLSRESAQSVANRFLVALAEGDVAELTELSSMPGQSKEEIQKAWEYTTGTVGPHYRFTWTITVASEANNKNANVKLQLLRNVGSPQQFEQKLEIPLVRDDRDWKVDVRALNRDLYPGLPR